VFENDPETLCKTATDCISGYLPIWYEETKQCMCEPQSDPDKDRCLMATTCVPGSHPFWNPSTKKCSCKDDNGESICKTLTLCPQNTYPVWTPLTETCNCVKSVKEKRAGVTAPKKVDLTTCPTILCQAGYTPQYIPAQARCSCVKIPVITPPSCLLTIKCAPGYISNYDPQSKICSCKPDPTKCLDLMCIAEQIPVYNLTTGRCGCQWIPGLQPVTGTLKSIIARDACSDVMCIAEMVPKLDPVTGQCNCVWISGLQPSTSKPPAPTPTEYDPLGCRKLLVYCPYGDHFSHYNPKTKKCQCLPKSGSW